MEDQRNFNVRKFVKTLFAFGLSVLLAISLFVLIALLVYHNFPQAGEVRDFSKLSPVFTITGTIFSAIAFSGVLFTVYKQAKDSASIAATQRLQTLTTFIDALRIRARYYEDKGKVSDAEGVREMLDQVYVEVWKEYQGVFKSVATTKTRSGQP